MLKKLLSVVLISGCGSESASATVAPDAAAEAAPPAVDAGPADVLAIPPAAPGCAGAPDPNFSFVVALVPCLVDTEAVLGKGSVEAFNLPRVAIDPPGAPGGASCSLGNAGVYGSAKGLHVTFNEPLGAEDFTIEFSIFRTASSDPTDHASNIWTAESAFEPKPGGVPAFASLEDPTIEVVAGSGATRVVTNLTDAKLGEWESYAATRADGLLRLFRNGKLSSSTADTSSYDDHGAYVSHQKNGTYNALMGSVAQIRVTKGIARYTADYAMCPNGFSTN